ncbi:MAG: PAS domain S-box protein [Desulfobacteraceae bacterium]|jgi:PAS domain S-box-containing protein/putative nucleotidyltransferase with HDIG domain
MDPSAPPDREKDISSQWLLALVESALDGVITMDDKGRIIAFNPAAERIFGYGKQQVIGRRVSDMIIPKQKRKDHELGLSHYLETGMEKIIGRRVEVNAMRADQTIFPAEMEVLSVQAETPAVFMAYIRDISKQKQAEREQRKYALNIKKTLVQTILAISRMVEISDPYTAGHQSRVAHLAAAMAEALELSGECIEGVFLGALIHDIGKIAVPAEILSRPGKLRDEDIKYLQIHCLKGYEILKPVDFPWPVAQIAHQHHEHMDGSGYPHGLSGEEIRLEARIICVADVVESLTAHRPYRPAYPLDDALQLITDKAGKWYDRRIVKACRALFKSGYRIDAIDMDALTWISSLSE